MLRTDTAEISSAVNLPQIAVVCKGHNCPKTYLIDNGYGGAAPRLIFRDAYEKKNKAQIAMRRAWQAVADHPAFAGLETAINDKLAAEKSMVAKHRKLVSAHLHAGTLVDFRKKKGVFELSEYNAAEALAFLGIEAPELKEKVAAARTAQEDSYISVPAVATGINGMIA